ncbi:sensor histidine kinase [Chloroflexus sp.]|uniref:sensor histidine kinase n=1 Tax=Chloroflexus sp. TaxID=1904827 RepID=UPI0026191013|nr:ATP-binding protein [uncultured Chloroflexus sp.]
MNRLIVQLSFSFAMLIVASVVILTLAVDRLADTSFRRYLVQSQIVESGLIDRLRNWYIQHRGWDGVETIIPGPSGGWGHGQGGIQAGQRPAVALADSNGWVVADPRDIVDQRLSMLQQRDAIPIVVDQQIAGYLVARFTTDRLSGVAAQLLQQLRMTIWLVGGVITLIAILVGVALARQLGRPLQHLARVAHQLGSGQLAARAVLEGPVEVQQVAAAFNQMATDLDAVMRQRRQMIADIAHELRTPLTIIQGNLRAILDDVYPLNREEIGHIYEATIGLRRLVDDLRELSLADSGQLTLHRYPIDLNQLIRREVELFRELAAAQEVAIHFLPATDLSPVMADSERIAQVIRNLLSNALRYTPAGGSITIVTALQDAGAQVSVVDTGSGIAPDDLPHVFERFYRADRSRSRSHGGSGLGLAIVERLITLHGGRVGVESELGKGSRVWFWLPVVASEMVEQRADVNR